MNISFCSVLEFTETFSGAQKREKKRGGGPSCAWTMMSHSWTSIQRPAVASVKSAVDQKAQT